MDNRRRFERIPYSTDLVIDVDGTQIPAVSENISRGGMLLIIPREIEFGASVTLRFRLPKIPDEISVRSTVRWVKPGEDDEYGIGVQFEELRPIEVWALNDLLKS